MWLITGRNRYELFGELGKRIGNASKGVAKKASEIADSAGVSVQIAGLERERDEIYRDLGKMVMSGSEHCPQRSSASSAARRCARTPRSRRQSKSICA